MTGVGCVCDVLTLKRAYSIIRSGIRQSYNSYPVWYPARQISAIGNLIISTGFSSVFAASTLLVFFRNFLHKLAEVWLKGDLDNEIAGLAFLWGPPRVEGVERFNHNKHRL